jgi:hypothetical protein
MQLRIQIVYNFIYKNYGIILMYIAVVAGMGAFMFHSSILLCDAPRA